MSYTRYIILSSPRSGTHMLRSALGAHENLVCLSEVFNPHWYPDPPYNGDVDTPAVLHREIWGDYPDRVHAAGFCVHRSGAPLGRHQDLFAVLDEINGLKVISLRRRNLLRRYLSYRIMREDKGRPPIPKSLTVDELTQEFMAREAELAAYDRRFGDALLPVVYEDLVADFSKEIQRIQHFLKVRACQLHPVTKPNLSRPLSALIKNIEYLSRRFEATRWGWFFEEPASAEARASISFNL